MKTILVLTDFSIRAQYAAEFAMQLAIKLEADILLCNAMDIVDAGPIAEPLAWPVVGQMELKQDSLVELKNIGASLTALIPTESDSVVYRPAISYMNDFGKLSDVARKVLSEKSIDMIVMGAHKSSGLARFLFGSHTHELLDNINCPVLLIPECLPYKIIRSVAYATDLTFSDLKVIDYLSSISLAFNAEIFVSHISPYGTSELNPDNVIQHPACEKLKANHPKVYYTSIKGANVTKKLLEITGSGNADLLVLVHKRYTFFEGLFHASVSKQLASNARVPLLILPYSFSVDIADMSQQQLNKYCFEPHGGRP